MRILRKNLAVLAALATLCGSGGMAGAAPFILTNAPGDATVTVGVDGYGAFGSSVGGDSTDANYDPVGAIGVAGTTFESGVAIRFGAAGPRSFLTSGDIGGSGGLVNPAVAGNATSATSSFTFGGLSFSLTQTLTPLLDGPTQTGSLLTQTYAITNTTGGTLDFELLRYIDGDLQFDGSITDGGGRLVLPDGTEILFETDTAAGTATSTTFVGITATGGTIPGTNRYEVDSFAGLRDRIISGSGLDNTITGDGGDADQFIDTGSGYDVTLALRNLFSLGAGASTTYTTQTIFGTGAPEDIPDPDPDPGVVPAPPAFVLMGIGIFGLAGYGWRRRKVQA
jgi:hypothetical protein